MQGYQGILLNMSSLNTHAAGSKAASCRSGYGQSGGRERFMTGILFWYYGAEHF
jgi:hypothetical protein